MDRPAELQIAERNVEEGERLVAQQRQTVARLRAGGHDSGIAERLLEKFELSLQALTDHMELVRLELEEERPRRH